MKTKMIQRGESTEVMTGNIVLEDKEFRPFIPEHKMAEAIKGIAEQINNDFKGEEVIFLSVLNGSFMFTSDLVKLITVPCRVTFTKLASYSNTSSTGVVKSLIGLHESLEDKNVIILEDIVDTGLTLQKLFEEMEGRNPRSLKIASMLFKPDAYKGDAKIDYVGLEIPPLFIVGYGLDYNGLGRNLPMIYQVIE